MTGFALQKFLACEFLSPYGNFSFKSVHTNSLFYSKLFFDISRLFWDLIDTINNIYVYVIIEGI